MKNITKYDINKENSIDDNQNSDNAQNQMVNPCVQCFKVCCKKKANFGLEDLFWLSFLILIIILSVVKSTTRIGWSQFIYVICGSVIGLIVVYISASIINKFCFEDANTAHWNAHARFTQAALAARLQQEEHKVHVIAPPRMGGAKLNILYTVGDVPIVVPSKGIHGIPIAQPQAQPPQPPPPTSNTDNANACPQRVTPVVTPVVTDSPTASATVPPMTHKNISKGGVGSGGDLSPKYELPEEPPNYANSEAQERY